MDEKEKNMADHITKMFKLIELVGLNEVSRSINCMAQDIRTVSLLTNSDPDNRDAMLEELRKVIIESLAFSGIKASLIFEKPTEKKE